MTNSINNKNGRIFDPVSHWEVKGSFGCPFCFLVLFAGALF